MRSSSVGIFGGIKIVENPQMLVTVEDWSKVRSPSRARRRLKRGFKQNIQYNQVPDTRVLFLKAKNTAIMHPSVGVKMRAEMAKKFDSDLDRLSLNGIRGSTL